MTYTDLALLPKPVKSSLLKTEDRATWMETFNKSYAISKSERIATRDAWNALRDSTGCRYFEGFFSANSPDKQGDIVEAVSLLKSIDALVERGGFLLDSHQNRPVGHIFHVEMRKTDKGNDGPWGCGTVFYGDEYFSNVWQDVLKGDKNAFSIGGFALDTMIKCSGDVCHRHVNNESIQEMTICKNPAHEEARMTFYNKLAKSFDEIMKDGKICIDASHLAEDKDKFLKIRALIDELLADDEKVVKKEVKPLKPEQVKEDDSKDEIEKSGTHVGACKGHKTKGDELSEECDRTASKFAEESVKDEKFVPDKEYVHRPRLPNENYEQWKKRVSEPTYSEDDYEKAMKLVAQHNNLLSLRNPNDVPEDHSKRLKELEDKLDSMGYSAYPTRITDREGWTVGYTHQKKPIKKDASDETRCAMCERIEKKLTNSPYNNIEKDLMPLIREAVFNKNEDEVMTENKIEKTETVSANTSATVIIPSITTETVLVKTEDVTPIPPKDETIAKLDAIMKSLENITARIDVIEKKSVKQEAKDEGESVKEEKKEKLKNAPSDAPEDSEKLEECKGKTMKKSVDEIKKEISQSNIETPRPTVIPETQREVIQDKDNTLEKMLDPKTLAGMNWKDIEKELRKKGL